VTRNKGYKDYSKSEKQLLISLINDYSLFGATDNEVIQMLSQKIGKNISESLFYRLMKEAKAKRGNSNQWINSYIKQNYEEIYRKRIEDLEYVQRCLLKLLVEEIEKEREKQDKTIINQLSKTIAEISNTLVDFGMAPPIISKILDLIPTNYTAQRNPESEYLKIIRTLRQQAKSAITIPYEEEYQYLNKEASLTEEDDPKAIF